MSVKKRFPIFIIFIFFILLTYQGARGGISTSGISFLHYPLEILEQGISTVFNGVMNFFRSYILIAGKEAENRKLLGQIKKMEEESNQYLETKYENERLRALLGLKQQKAKHITVAEIFARDPTNWFQLLWINKGRNDGIADNMVAVTPSGVIGRMHRVLGHSAAIILITDVNSSVAVRIQSTRIEGILEGNGDRICFLKYVPNDVDVSVGDRVITSGVDGIYPEGLEVGYITSASKNTGDFFQLIKVKPAQNLNAVEEVSILKR